VISLRKRSAAAVDGFAQPQAGDWITEFARLSNTRQPCGANAYPARRPNIPYTEVVSRRELGRSGFKMQPESVRFGKIVPGN
jgi:hypothetical protein